MPNSLPASYLKSFPTLPYARLATRLLLALSCSTALITVSACAGLDKLKALEANDGYDLPVVENPSDAATIRIKSNDNPSEVQFLHLLGVDGTIIMKLGEGDRREFQLDPGDYEIGITCHLIPNPDRSSLPINLSVVDGRDSLELSVAEGDESCLKISKNLVTCANIEQVASSICG